MSTQLRDSIEEHKNIAKKIQHFMWEGKPHKSEKKEHTLEELEEFIESIRRDSWSSYDDGAGYLGWK